MDPEIYSKKKIQINKKKYELYCRKKLPREIRFINSYPHVSYYMFRLPSVCRKFYFDYDFIITNVISIKLSTVDNGIIHESKIENMPPKILNTVDGKKKLYEFYPITPFIMGNSIPYNSYRILIELECRIYYAPRDPKTNNILYMYYEYWELTSFNFMDSVICFSNEEYYADKHWKIIYDGTIFPTDIINLIFSYLPKRKKFIALDGKFLKYELYLKHRRLQKNK